MSIDLLEEYIEAGNGPAIEDLLSSNPRLASGLTSHGISPLLLTCYYNKPHLAKLLIKNLDRLSLFEAAAIGDLEEVRKFVEADGHTVDAISAHGFSVLGIATEFGQVDIIHFLLGHHADPNQASHNGFMVYPLHTAVGKSNLTIAKMLLEANAEVNVLQASRISPLHLAAQSGNIDLIILLLEYGARVEIRNDQDLTASDLAMERGHPEIAAILKV